MPDPMPGLVHIEWVPWSRQTRTVWNADAPDHLWLLRPDELERLPKGTLLTCINGQVAEVGSPDIDGDTRGGLLAYGLLESQLPPYRTSVKGKWETDQSDEGQT